MPKIRNVSGADRTLLDARFVPDDGVVEVSADELDGYLCQPDTWRLVSDSKPRHTAAKDEE